MASPSVFPDRRFVMNAVSGGLKVDTGSFTPTAATGTVTTKLSTVSFVMVNTRTLDATHSWTTADASGGTAGQFTWATWKPDPVNTNTAMIAATTPWNTVEWIAFGV